MSRVGEAGGAVPGAEEEDTLMPLARRVAENRPLRPTEHGQFVLTPHNDTEKYRDVAWTCIGHIANVAEASRKMSAAERADAVVDCGWWTEEAGFTEAGTVRVNTQMDVLLPAVPGTWNTHMLTAHATCGVLFALQDFVPDAATGAALVREMETLGGGMGQNIPSRELSAQGVKFIGRYDWDYYRSFPPAGETLEEGFPWPERDTYEPFDGPAVFLAQTNSILTKVLPWFAGPDVMDALGDFNWQPREGETQEQFATRQRQHHERQQVVLPGGLLTVDSPSDDAAAPPAGALAHFSGAEYMFGRVWFEPDGRRARALLAFNYNMPDLFADTELGGVPVGPLVEGFPASVSDEDLAACVAGTTRPRLTKLLHDGGILTDPVQMQRLLAATPQLADAALVVHAVSKEEHTAAMIVLKTAQESGVLKKMADHDNQMVKDPTVPDLDVNEMGVRATYDIYAKCRLREQVDFLLQSGYPLSSSVSQNMWDKEQTFDRKPFIFLYPAPEVMDVVLGSLAPEQARLLVNEVYKSNGPFGQGVIAMTPLEDALLSGERPMFGQLHVRGERAQRIAVLLKYGADIETVGAAREGAKEDVVGCNAMDLSARAALMQVIARAMGARNVQQHKWAKEEQAKKVAAEPPREVPAFGGFGFGGFMVQPSHAPPNIGVAEAEAEAEQAFNDYRTEVELLRERGVRCRLTYDDVNKSQESQKPPSFGLFGAPSDPVEVNPWEEEFNTKWKAAIRKLYWE